MANTSLLVEVWLYLKERKKWWLAPLLLLMILAGAIMALANGSVLAPFIYSIF